MARGRHVNRCSDRPDLSLSPKPCPREQPWLWRPTRRPFARLLAVFLAASLCGPSARAEDWPPAPPLDVATDGDPGELPPSVTAVPAGPQRWRCTFTFEPSFAPMQLVVAGSFNEWNLTANRMERDEQTGEYRATIELPAGKHLYKYVLNGGDWQPDPRNPDREPDGFTSHNSVLRLGKLARMTESDAKRGDGRVMTEAIEHEPHRPLFFQWLTAGRALIRLRTLANDAEQIELTIRDGPTVAMRPVVSEALHETYEADVEIPPGAMKGRNKLIDYTFVFRDGELRRSHPQVFSQGFADVMLFKTPEWARHAVWYQIMIDRFRNGNQANDPENCRPWTSEWFTASPWETESGQTFYKWFVFYRLYGGDIDGLEGQLPYLKALGVNALYLNPVFKSDTHHKYDAINYLHIDDHFGTKGDYEAAAAKEDLLDPKTWVWTESDRRFLRFLKSAKSMGFRVVIDGVFNHVGVGHPAFQDVRRHGQQSRFADWFDVTSWQPFKYNGWAGHDALPVFKKSRDGLASETCKQHLFNVTRRWMDPDGDGDPRDGIDGWRLDVPNEIALPFWEEWRQLVKKINPDAYITGEIWQRADQWLDGRHFDAVMNYQFAEAVVAWVFHKTPPHKLTARQFDARLAELRLAYPEPATYVMQNLMGSHDTDRVASMAHNPDLRYDQMNRVQDTNPKYDNSKPSPEAYARTRLATFIQMTYVGAPMIYYGDEAGMWGADDPTCRKPMLWEDLQPYDKPEENFVMKDHLAAFREMIALRNAHPALRTGSFRTILADDAADVWVFLRHDGKERIIVAVNASNAPASVNATLPPGAGGGVRRLYGTDATSAECTGKRMTITLPPIGAAAWLLAE